MNPKLLAPSATGQRRRLEWLTGRLKQYLEGPGFFDSGPRPAVQRYMAFGFSMGLSRAALEASLSSMPELQPIAGGLSDEEVSQGKPAPEFFDGQLVEVLVHAGGTGHRQAAVRGRNWHRHQGRWVFFLEEDGGKVSKRYDARELRAAPTRTARGHPQNMEGHEK